MLLLASDSLRPVGRTSCHALLTWVVIALAFCFALTSSRAAADEPGKTGAEGAAKQADLDAAFIKMLSNSVLEGSFTKTGPGADPTKLSQDKYTIGEVRKLSGKLWLIPARIQYGEHDVTLPVTVPVEWAGDTPVIVVDNLGLPGFGTVSGRVMFFADHYAGYWKHGTRGGHMFGVIRHEGDADDKQDAAPAGEPASRGDNPAAEQNNEQRGQQ